MADRFGFNPSAPRDCACDSQTHRTSCDLYPKLPQYPDACPAYPPPSGHPPFPPFPRPPHHYPNPPQPPHHFPNPPQPPHYPNPPQPPHHFPNPPQPPHHYPNPPQPPSHYPNPPQPSNWRPPYRPSPPHSSSGGISKPYYWVDTNSYGGVPSTAIHGGMDSDGSEIFVGRAYHDGDWIPAKVIPSKRVAYVSYGGEEYSKDQFQVLCEQRFDWVPSSNGHIPAGAVEGGRTSDGETLFIGRAYHEGSQTVGKVHPSHGCCYIPYAGREHSYRDYEILVLRS